MEGKWEVVNTKQKKQQKQQQKAEKKLVELQEKKKAQDEDTKKKKEEMQRFLSQYASASGIETSSLFSALVGFDETKQKKASDAKEKKSKESTFNPEEGEVIVFKDTNKKKQKQKQTSTTEIPQHKEQKLPIESIAATVDKKYVKAQIEELTEKYPSDSSIQFVCFAELLETSFNSAKLTKDYHSLPLDQRIEYPLKYLKRDAIHEMEEWLHSIQKSSIQGLCWILITTLQNIIDRKLDSNGIGIEMALSILTRTYSHSLIQNIELIKENFTKKDNAGNLSLIPKYSPMLLWLCGQPIIPRNFAVGLTCTLLVINPVVTFLVWTDLFLPQLLKRESGVPEKLKEECILFAESLALSTQKGHTYLDENGVSTYDVLLNSKFNSGELLNERAIKALATISEFNSVFQKTTYSIKLFKLLLKYGTSDTESIRQEVLDNLALLLERDKRYFSVWKEQYLKHIPQSSNLLSHLLNGWSDSLHNYSSKVPADEMTAIISHISTTNDSARTSKKLRASEKSALDIIDQTLKVLERAIKKTGGVTSQRNRENKNSAQGTPSSSFGFGIVGFLTLSSLGIGYIAFNCCYMEWCKQNSFLGTDIFHCSK